MADGGVGEAILISLIISAATTAASYAAQRLLTPKAQPNKVGELTGAAQIQTVQEGTFIRQIFGGSPNLYDNTNTDKQGGVMIAGNFIYISQIRKTITLVQGGGGGGKAPPKPPPDQHYSYDADMLVGICEGVVRFTQLQANTDLIYDINGINGGGGPGGGGGGGGGGGDPTLYCRTGQHWDPGTLMCVDDDPIDPFLTGAFDPGFGGEASYNQFNPPDPNSSDTNPTGRYGLVPTADAQGTTAVTVSAGGYASLTFYSGTHTQLPDPTYQAAVGVANASAFRGTAYFALVKFVLDKYGTVPNLRARAESIDKPTCKEYAEKRCKDAGVDPANFNFTGLASKKIRGMFIDSQQAPNQDMDEIGKLFAIDWFETIDGVITGQDSNGSVIATIPESDLGVSNAADDGPTATDTAEPPSKIITTDADAIDLPRFFDLKYIDPTRQYEQGTQTGMRQTAPTQKRSPMSVNITFLPDEAIKIAQRLLDLLYLQDKTFDFVIFYKWAWIDPAQIVIVRKTTEQGLLTYTIKLNELSGGLPGLMTCSAIPQSAVAYDQTVTADTSGSTPLRRLPVPANSIMSLIDIAQLRDTDNTPGFYAAGGPRDLNFGSWLGAILYWNYGSGYQRLAQFKNPSTMGRTIGTLATGTLSGWDNVNTITVDLYYGEFTSLTDAEVLAGANIVVVGDEALAFGVATKISGHRNRWALSHLRRGVKDTFGAVGGHGASERVVFLTDSVQFIRMDLDRQGDSIFYKLVTMGQSIDDAAEVSFTWTGKSSIPDAVTGAAVHTTLSTARANPGKVIFTWDFTTHQNTNGVRLRILKAGVLVTDWFFNVTSFTTFTSAGPMPVGDPGTVYTAEIVPLNGDTQGPVTTIGAFTSVGAAPSTPTGVTIRPITITRPTSTKKTTNTLRVGFTTPSVSITHVELKAVRTTNTADEEDHIRRVAVLENTVYSHANGNELTIDNASAVENYNVIVTPYNGNVAGTPVTTAVSGSSVSPDTLFTLAAAVSALGGNADPLRQDYAVGALTGAFTTHIQVRYAFSNSGVSNPGAAGFYQSDVRRVPVLSNTFYTTNGLGIGSPVLTPVQGLLDMRSGQTGFAFIWFEVIPFNESVAGTTSYVVISNPFAPALTSFAAFLEDRTDALSGARKQVARIELQAGQFMDAVNVWATRSGQSGRENLRTFDVQNTSYYRKATNTDFQIDNLLTGVDYVIGAEPVCGPTWKGTASTSTITGAGSRDTAAPGDPTALTLTKDDGVLVLRWEAPTTNLVSLDWYTVSIGTGDNGTSITGAFTDHINIKVEGTQYTAPLFAHIGTTVFVRVKAHNQFSGGSFSAGATANIAL